jgi:hypothetical protein
MSSKKKGGGQEGALSKMLDLMRVRQAAGDAAKKLWRMQQRKRGRQRGWRQSRQLRDDVVYWYSIQ